jgi:hypothetical protein
MRGRVAPQTPKAFASPALRAKLRAHAFCFAEFWECVRVLAPLFGALLAPPAEVLINR